MGENTIVIMEKNIETNFLETELATLKIQANDEYLLNVFVMREKDENAENENLKLHLKISTDKDVEDWQYEEIFNQYNEEIYAEMQLTISEDLEEFNPTWEIVFDYNDEALENQITKILSLHKTELSRINNEMKSDGE